MLRELADLREDAAGLAEELAPARYLRFTGRPQPSSLRELIRSHKLATSVDGVAQAREALQNALSEEPLRHARVARLTSLREFLAQAHALALEPAAAQELFDLPQRPLVRPPGDAGLHGALPAVAVLRDLPRLRSRERRAELEAALEAALQPSQGASSAVWDAAQSARAEAGLAVPEDAEEWATRLLDLTDALQGDLGAWLLERHTGVKPGTAARHDVLHLLHAPRCSSAFIAGELQRTVRRWAEMLRFDLSEVKVDDDDRPLKWPGAHAEPLDPPYEAGISLLPAEGPRALSSLLSALGVALMRVGPPQDAPPEDLWMGDPAVRHACAAVLGGLLLEPGWLRRCARVELQRDDERALAIAALLDARIAAARILGAIQAQDAGLGARAAAAYRELYARATGAELPQGLALADLDPWFDPFAQLRGLSLAARVRAFLRERYDEDWWRNPRSVPSLSGLWSRGGRPILAEVWGEMGGEPSLDFLVVGLTSACQ
ncbi:MAG: hypothetical protein ACM3PC_11500 [Deltaproteobacteria bacterium]